MKRAADALPNRPASAGVASCAKNRAGSDCDGRSPCHRHVGTPLNDRKGERALAHLSGCLTGPRASQGGFNPDSVRHLLTVDLGSFLAICIERTLILYGRSQRLRRFGLDCRDFLMHILAASREKTGSDDDPHLCFVNTTSQRCSSLHQRTRRSLLNRFLSAFSKPV